MLMRILSIYLSKDTNLLGAVISLKRCSTVNRVDIFLEMLNHISRYHLLIKDAALFFEVISLTDANLGYVIIFLADVKALNGLLSLRRC